MSQERLNPVKKENDERGAASYREQAQFFEKTEPSVIGDLRNRPQLLTLLGDVQGHTVLEAGCGTGYVARMLAERGAQVHGCDLSFEMLQKATAAERGNPLGIAYVQADLTALPYADNSMDDILSSSVLFHLTREENKKFFQEALRVLKPGGSIVVGVLHPSLFEPGSPNRREGKSWAKYTPVVDVPLDGSSEQFDVEYYDKNGGVFESQIWSHNMETYLNLMTEAGLVINEIREPKIEKDDLLVPEWGTEYGYPAFLHIRATKPLEHN